jgi:hypothetical protein
MICARELLARSGAAPDQVASVGEHTHQRTLMRVPLADRRDFRPTSADRNIAFNPKAGYDQEIQGARVPRGPECCI